MKWLQWRDENAEYDEYEGFEMKKLSVSGCVIKKKIRIDINIYFFMTMQSVTIYWYLGCYGGIDNKHCKIIDWEV